VGVTLAAVMGCSKAPSESKTGTTSGSSQKPSETAKSDPDAAPTKGAAPTRPEVTEALMVELATGKVPMDRFVDPQRGVQVITSEAGNPPDGRKVPDEFTASVACTPDEIAKLTGSFHVIARWADDAKTLSEVLHCTNDADRASCEYDDGAEDGTAVEYQFVRTDAGPFLDEIVSKGGCSPCDAFSARADAHADKSRKERTACAAKGAASANSTVAVPVDAPVQTGEVDDTTWKSFFYDWDAASGKVRLEFAIDDQPTVTVSALVDGKRTPVTSFSPNVGGKTSLRVHPLPDGKTLGIAVVSDWSDGAGDLDVDAVQVHWDGKESRVEGLKDAPAWAK